TLKDDPAVIEFIGGVGYKDIPNKDAAKKAVDTYNKNITNGKVLFGGGINKGRYFKAIDPDKAITDIKGNVVGQKTVDDKGNIKFEYTDGTTEDHSADGKSVKFTNEDGKSTTFTSIGDGKTQITKDGKTWVSEYGND
ncbi:hypothetical protein HY029_01495, partial [Candidatus Gottesmanbacteria bacterium]|nr:hypothetical protein [Candidatus Gottesmanbacteria bacterium]